MNGEKLTPPEIKEEVEKAEAQKEKKELSPQEIAERINSIPYPYKVLRQRVKEKMQEEGLNPNEWTDANRKREEELKAELAPQIIEEIKKEPFLAEPRAYRGIENCKICGGIETMGGVIIIKNSEKVSVEFQPNPGSTGHGYGEIKISIGKDVESKGIPFMAVHALKKHGSAEFEVKNFMGTKHVKSKVDLKEWSKFLTSPEKKLEEE